MIHSLILVLGLYGWMQQGKTLHITSISIITVERR